ncbi:hypothetical protein JOC77_001344 [Peribacillus deserti]|uniref:Type II secretion system protein n=1 Tax=Peribacillus deserti TaxID=673318 RepID=A0ABS2QGI6_9BACI|nr:hypothetical protein [Peribacillus deserti]MBM7691934.1 hypothetical protein [Peribacillus deserti]
MNRFSSQEGNALINVLIIFTLLTAGAALLYPLIIQNADDQTRSYHQLQTVKLATTTMQAYFDDKDSIIENLYTESSPQKIKLADESIVDLYSYASDSNGVVPRDKLPETKAYDFNVAAYYGDTDSDREKDSGEKYFYEKKLSTKSEQKQDQKTVKPELSFYWDTGSINACKNFENIRLYLIIKMQDRDSKIRIYQKTKSTLLTINPVKVDDTTYKVNVLQGLLYGNLQSFDLNFLVTAEGPYKSESEPSLIDANNIYRALGYWSHDKNSNGGFAEYLDSGIKIFLTDSLKKPLESEGEIEVFPCTQFVSDKPEIIVQAKNGIQLDQFASLTAEQNGQGRVKLLSSSGNIILKSGSLIEGDANSNKSIVLEAEQGTIFLEPNSNVLGAKEIFFNGKSIIVEHANFETKHGKANIDLYSKNRVYVNGLNLSYEEKSNGKSSKKVLNAETTLPNFDTFCGKFDEGAIDGRSVFSNSCPKPLLVN